MSAIIKLDARSDSLTITWPAAPGATQYRLEFRKAESRDFELLSDKLTQTQAKKKNLTPSTEYFFKVTPIVIDEPQDEKSMTHDEAFATLSKEADMTAMAAPLAVGAGTNQALKISWSKFDSAEAYELQMRENTGGSEWSTIAASLSGVEVRKKNLTSSFGYQFRVRPSGSTIPFSPPSDPMVARGLSLGIKRWFNSLNDGTLLRSGVDAPVRLEDALGGKEFVLLYVSAHWCPPCRKFTPMLANWYRSVRDNVEVVFLSADHDENGFTNYFKTHPWMAVDYDDDARESLMATIKVSGIPRLVVLSGKTGKIIEDNAVGKPFDLVHWRQLDG